MRGKKIKHRAISLFIAPRSIKSAIQERMSQSYATTK
uniref:Uncharacterized protein n=1 Tax=Anguilla anguilla TaxID=7936 RepID=A0A0E9RID2_ANGAN